MAVRGGAGRGPGGRGLAADMGRVIRIWDESLRRVGAHGAFLCGGYSLAVGFYGPVAFRFQTYGVEPGGAAGAYLEALLAHPDMREWERAALAETTIVEADEPRHLYRDKIAAA